MRPRRSSTLGDDPLAAVFPPSSTGPAARQEAPRSARAITVGVSLAPDVLERARNAVYWTPGLKLTALATTALAAAVDDLEHERGQPFPARAGKASLRRLVGALGAKPQDYTTNTSELAKAQVTAPLGGLPSADTVEAVIAT